MSEQLQLRPQDRVLVVAPHPDDESIGAGGLLQATRAAGAAVRVLLLTNGDNNPWPQRWIEKRWHIGAAERARWGARRRGEALAAIGVLGLDAHDVRFLGLPDLGLTELLMRADTALIDTLTDELSQFAPTLLVFPAISDRHPDHNAAHVLMRVALEKCASLAPRLLTFAVHGDAAAHRNVELALDPERRQAKQAAILAHATQMQFSRRRFLAFAGDCETFESAPNPGTSDSEHPVRATADPAGLRTHIDLARWGGAWRDAVLFVALERGDGSLRVQVDLAHGSAIATAGATQPRISSLRRSEAQVELTLELPGPQALSQGFVKLSRREPGWRVFDRCGWQFVAS